METLEKFKGFVTFFEEKWTEMNRISSRQAGFINAYEKKKIIDCMERLRTPRDEIYQAEIQKLKDKFKLLAIENQTCWKAVVIFNRKLTLLGVL